MAKQVARLTDQVLVVHFFTLGLSIVSGDGLGINLCFLMVEFRIGRDRCLGALNSRLREGKLKSRTINTHRTS